MDFLAGLVGETEGILSLRQQAQKLLAIEGSRRRLPSVLIQGETGTGKGLLARLMHEGSGRTKEPFVTINCAAIPENLLEAELFGFERGAFTDARQAKPGLFQAANHGTLFLDEIGSMPLGPQAKLLSALEDRAVRRLGSTRTEAIDVWFLAATSEDLRIAAQERRFREDLYHRLSTITLTLPPLRERVADIAVLAEHFLADACRDYERAPKRLTADARLALSRYPWPGNVRELSNLMERLAVLLEDDVVTAADLRLPATATVSTAPSESAPDLRQSLGDFERTRLVNALRATHGNLSKTASLLGIPRNTLRYRVSKYGLHGAGGDDVAIGARPAGDAAAAAASPTRNPAASRRSALDRHPVVLLWAAADAPPDAPAAGPRTELLDMMCEKVRAFGGSLEDTGPASVLGVFGPSETDEPHSAAMHAALAIKRVLAQSTTGRGVPGLRALIHAADGLPAGPGEWSLHPDDRETVIDGLADLTARVDPDSILVSRAAAAPLRARFSLVAASAQDPSPLFRVVMPIPVVAAKPSIAVLSFRNLTGNPEQDYFSDGISEDLASGLSRVRWLFVVASGSTGAYKTRSIDVRQIAAELGVRYLLSGTVRTMEARLRVTAELVDAEAQNVIWSEPYDGSLVDIFDFQDRITSRIVATLDARVRGAEIERAFRKRPESLDAYDCVLRGLSLAHRLFTPDFFRAEQLFERAIALDPQFAAAYAWCSWWYLLKIGEGVSVDAEADVARACEFAEAALERDVDDPIALAMSGHAASLDHEFDRALQRFERSLALNPNCAFTWGLSGATFCYIGEAGVALDRALHALRLSPFDLFSFYFAGIAGLAEMLLGRYEQAVTWAMKCRAEKPRYSANLRKLAACLAHVGRLEEARVVGQEFLALQTGFTLSAFQRRYPLRDRTALARYVEGLRLAGLPE